VIYCPVLDTGVWTAIRTAAMAITPAAGTKNKPTENPARITHPNRSRAATEAAPVLALERDWNKNGMAVIAAGMRIMRLVAPGSLDTNQFAKTAAMQSNDVSSVRLKAANSAVI